MAALLGSNFSTNYNLNSAALRAIQAGHGELFPRVGCRGTGAFPVDSTAGHVTPFGFRVLDGPRQKTRRSRARWYSICLLRTHQNGNPR